MSFTQKDHINKDNINLMDRNRPFNVNLYTRVTLQDAIKAVDLWDQEYHDDSEAINYRFQLNIHTFSNVIS